MRINVKAGIKEGTLNSVVNEMNNGVYRACIERTNPHLITRVSPIWSSQWHQAFQLFLAFDYFAYILNFHS